jgi:hypothetical protein
MRIRSLFLISAILGIVLGLGFYFAPEMVMSTFGIDASEAHQHSARNFGSALIGLAVISWAARNSKDSIARRAIVLGLFIYFIFGTISIVSFQLRGGSNIYAWFIIVLHVVLIIGFGYHLKINRYPVDE